MVRLILLALVALCIVVVAICVVARLVAKPTSASEAKEDTMPDTFKTVAYVLLLMLMVGITTGLLAG